MNPMQTDPIVIVSAARTPIGNFQGNFKNIPAPELGASAIKAALARAHLEPEAIDEVLMGCVLPAGLGQAPARQAALAAGLPQSVPCTTVNKVCGSGMKAVMIAHDELLAGSANIIIAGGMESMSNAPYLLPKARAGYRLGHQTVLDHMFCDGLEDAYDKGRLMGAFAEECAEQYGFSREAQDAFAKHSIHKAQQATANNSFNAEIAPVTICGKEGQQEITQDEGPLTAQINKISQLKPAFKKEGTVTAANASSISDGAAAVLLMRRSEAQRRGLKPLAMIVGHSMQAQAPNLFTTAPIGAIQKLLKAIHWTVAEVDLFEINEAFAVVVMAAMQDLQLPADKVNIHGGACVLGHPIGASGARLIVTLLYALEKYHLKRGIAALCIGGGEATAIAVERL
jgi:acetyl-CoA C-acetyltransferase